LPALLGLVDPVHEVAELQIHALPLEVALKGSPEGFRHGTLADIKDQAFAISHEVEVEHHEQFASGHRLLGIEEGMGEDVKEHAPRCRWKAQRVQILAGRHLVVLLVGRFAVEGEHAHGCARIDLHQVAQRESLGAVGERDDIEGRGGRQVGKGLAGAIGAIDGIINHLLEHLEIRVHPP
jgi:hypothetical protein